MCKLNIKNMGKSHKEKKFLVFTEKFSADKWLKLALWCAVDFIGYFT